jgi:hypothetical protein
MIMASRATIILRTPFLSSSPSIYSRIVDDEFIYRHTQDATIPFKLTFSMPPLDKRTRGYTPKYIKELQTTVGGEW